MSAVQAPEAAPKAAWTIYGPPVRGRACGSCTACCTSVPTDLPSGHKPANTRCRHLGGKGCRIYAARPDPCRHWSCRWLFDPATAGLRRPDQSGVIIDPVPDTILNNDQPVDVLQIWCDPKRPDAHRDPALRAYLADVGARTGMASIVRWNSEDGFILVPPCMTRKGEWLELRGSNCSEAAMAHKLAAVGARRLLQPAPSAPR